MTFLKKILLVDYEPRVTAVVRQALEETGKYLIKAEHDSRLALNAARWFQPDLILFDVNLTTLNGSSVARQLQVDPEFRDTPVVFLSVNTSFEGEIISEILSGIQFRREWIRIEEFVRYVGELFSMRATCVWKAYAYGRSCDRRSRTPHGVSQSAAVGGGVFRFFTSSGVHFQDEDPPLLRTEQ
jgi:CheY-like chemotaxis protein